MCFRPATINFYYLKNHHPVSMAKMRRYDWQYRTWAKYFTVDSRKNPRSHRYCPTLEIKGYIENGIDSISVPQGFFLLEGYEETGI